MAEFKVTPEMLTAVFNFTLSLVLILLLSYYFLAVALSLSCYCLVIAFLFIFLLLFLLILSPFLYYLPVISFLALSLMFVSVCPYTLADSLNSAV